MKVNKKEINKQVSEIKKECFKFILFYKLYCEILKDYKFSKISALQYLTKAIKPLYILSFEILSTLNKYFIIDEAAEDDDFKGEEIINKKCSNLFTGLITMLKARGASLKRQNPEQLKRYISTFLVELAQSNYNVINIINLNLNNYLSTMGLIFKELDKIKNKMNIEGLPEMSNLHKDFMTYFNRTTEYFENNQGNNEVMAGQGGYTSNVVDQSVNNSLQQLQESTKLKQIKFKTTYDQLIVSFYKARVSYFERSFPRLSINEFDFSNLKRPQLSAVKKQLKRMKEPKFSTNLYVPTQLKNGKINLSSSLSNKEFIKNLNEFYKMLLVHLSKLYAGDTLLLCILKESSLRDQLKSRISPTLLKQARRLAADDAVDEDPLSKKKLIPVKVQNIFKERCVDIMENKLPCLTQIACKNRTGIKFTTTKSKKSSAIKSAASSIKRSITKTTRRTNTEETDYSGFGNRSQRSQNTQRSRFNGSSNVDLDEFFAAEAAKEKELMLLKKKHKGSDNTHYNLNTLVGSEISLGKGGKKKRSAKRHKQRQPTKKRSKKKMACDCLCEQA